MEDSGFGAEFSWKLYRSVSSGVENVIISPQSVTVALMLAALGAKGETEVQIRKAVGLAENSASEAQTAYSKLSQNMKNKSDTTSGGLIVTIANKLFARKGLSVVEKFQKDSAELYSSGIQSMDFGGEPSECLKTINQWVEDNTMQKIKDILQEGMLSAATKLVLANAIYFKGKWDKPFKTEKTEKVDFHVSSSNVVKVDMMREKYDMYCVADDDLKFKAVSVPYQKRTMAMLILRPDEVDGISSLEEKMTTEKLTDTIGQLRRGMKAKVDLGLPKFKFIKTSDLSGTLPDLGITHLFDPSKADLSGMVSGETIAFTDVLHKAYIEVNEEGTEAAAATMMISRMMMMPTQEVSFICDRPFLFILADMENSAILFIGRYSFPSE